MKKVVFFNQFHNGDCFVGKGYVRALVQALPNVEFEYAHLNHPDIIKDLPVKYITLENLPHITHMTRIAESADRETIYINTWVGCWQGALFPHGEHINYQRLHTIWAKYFEYLNVPLGPQSDYLPYIDFSKFDLGSAQAWLTDCRKTNEKYILFCNGSANSGQSRAGDFKSVIETLAKEFTSIRFLLTSKLDLTGPNIYYTDDVLKLESDINQIAYLSKYARLVVGKNSGPFTFSQYAELLNDPDCTLFNFSILPTDCPNGGSTYLARCLYSPESDDRRITDLIRNVILNPSHRGTELLI